MVVTVSQGELLPFLVDRATDRGEDLAQRPNGLCLLVGETAIRNLRSALVSRGLDPEAVAQLETIQSVARTLAGRFGNPRVMPQSVKQRLLMDVVDSARAGDAPEPLQRLVAPIGDRWDDDLYEVLLRELETYWRICDAGQDHGSLASVVEEIGDPYAEHRTSETLSAFAALDTELANRMDGLDDDLYLSESHLLRDARALLSSRWDETFGAFDWIAMASIKAVDNGVLRFVRDLSGLSDAPDIHCLFNEGTSERMASRFQQAGISLSEPPPAATAEGRPVVDELVTAAAVGQAEGGTPDGVSFVEAPDRRRELEEVARRIRERCSDPDTERTPGDFLVVVREATPYRSTLTDIFASHGLPFHIEAQQPTAQVVAYRMIKATLDLVTADATDAVVEYHEVVAPIRLGFCGLGDAPGSWPIDDESFLDIEERLHELEANGDGPRTVADWRQAVDELAVDRGGPWEQMQAFLGWVGDRASDPPEDGSTVETVLQGIVEEHVSNTAGSPVRPSSGPGVDTTRTDVGTKHQTHLARGAVLDSLVKVRQYFDYLCDLSLASPSWSLAARALGETLGQSQYSVPNRDGNAVRVVIPANTFFLDAAHTYIVGLGADEFPTGALQPTFLHERFYEAVWSFAETSDEETAALLYAPSREQTFQRELDDYAATVRTASEQLTLSHHQRSPAGDTVPWSPFVDAFAAEMDENDEHYRRIRQSQWLPGPGWYGDWRATTTEAPMRDRLRLAVHHLKEGVSGQTFAPRLTTEAVTDEGTLIRLLLSVDGDDYDAIGPRHQRFSSPLTTVTVDGSEAAFEAPHDLESVVGGPIRAHEIDLFDHCELKYYFYQYFFSRDGATPRRDTWPEADTPSAADLYPTLPTVLGSHYAPGTYRRSMSRVVSEYLPDRQRDLGAFGDVGELRAAFERWRESDENLDESVFQTLVSEYLTVAQEQAAGRTREWAWVGGEDCERTVGSHTVRLPPHRVDTLEEEASVPVFASARPGTGRIATKNCWQPDGNGLRGETTDTVCSSCGKRGRCDVTTKGVIDSRVRARTTDDTAGALVVDRFQSAPRGRQGFYRADGPFEPVPHEQSLLELDETSWRIRRRRWDADLHETLDEMNPDGQFRTYEVSREFVENGGCVGCVFRGLCMVPTHFDEGVGEQ